MSVMTWEQAILRSIKSLGGKADLQQIYEIISDFKELTEDHLRITEWGGRPAYEHQIRSHVSNLHEEGYLDRISRGRYSLTEKGQRVID